MEPNTNGTLMWWEKNSKKPQITTPSDILISYTYRQNVCCDADYAQNDISTIFVL